MKIRRQRYQAGSVRGVSRAQGFAWEFRFYSTDADGVRRGKVQTFDSVECKTESDVRKAVHGQLAALNAGARSFVRINIGPDKAPIPVGHLEGEKPKTAKAGKPGKHTGLTRRS